jgi:hypothetical protein
LSSSRRCHKSGKSQLALSAPQPCLINLDRREDFLLEKMNLDILRDRIIMPPGTITPDNARAALRQFEGDMMQAKAMAKGGALDSVVIDGGSLLVDIITIVTLDESDNKNNTFKYADRNSYIKNLFNELNECGLNVVWTSKAKPVWVGERTVPNLYQPDCHAEIPYAVDINIQMVAEPSPEGLAFYGVIGTNAFNPVLTGKRFKDLDWKQLMVWLGHTPACSASNLGPRSSDSDHRKMQTGSSPFLSPH